jgi:ADP-ribosylglycohydrolase
MNIMTTIPHEDYINTTLGLWTGKFIGGTLGAPVEGLKEMHAFASADELPETPAENDDTDLQLLWLHALQQRGAGLTARDLAEEWREHVRAPWGEYGVAVSNWERGVWPPESGRANNWFFSESMGCPIRAEIWAAICPGAPAAAARFAGMDASLDHTGDSVEAERFIAAVEAAAYFEKDIYKLIDTGMSHVSPRSRFARLVRDVTAWSAQGDWRETRARVLRDYGAPDFTQSRQNLGFTLLGLLHSGGDFARTILLALNCGYDSDCTAATAGAIAGAVLGYADVPERWRKAAGDRYVVSDWMLGFPREGSIRELTRACAAQARKVSAHFGGDVEIGPSPANDEPPPLDVRPQPAAPVLPAKTPFPVWRVIGPFWRQWEERRSLNPVWREHPSDRMPSTFYMFHASAGFDRDWLDLAALSLSSPVPDGAAAQQLRAMDDRLPLADAFGCENPLTCYAVAEFDVPTARRAWLMAGSTGPVRVWLDGEEIIASDSYQPLSPCTFAVDKTLAAGRHRIAFKLCRTSQPPGAYFAIKRHIGKHWHHCFFDTGIDWVQW